MWSFRNLRCYVYSRIVMRMLKKSGRGSIEMPPEDKSEALTLEDRSAPCPARGPHMCKQSVMAALCRGNVPTQTSTALLLKPTGRKERQSTTLFL